MATSAELYASAQILGTECATANMNFLKCKAEAQHPRHCLEAGTAVTSCAVRKSTNELGYPENYCVDLRDLVNLHAIERARNLISTQVLRRRPHRFSQSEEWRGVRGVPGLPGGHEQRVRQVPRAEGGAARGVLGGAVRCSLLAAARLRGVYL